MVADQKEKTYTAEQYSKLQEAKDLENRDLKRQLREATNAREEAETNLSNFQVKVADLQGQISATEDLIKALGLEPDAEARLRRLIKGEGELSRRNTEYNTVKNKFEKDAKPVKEKALKFYADDLVAKSGGQFTAETLLAQGDEAKMDRYWLDHYTPAAAKPPETPPGQGDGQNKKGPEDKSGLPGLPGAGGTPGKTSETEYEFLQKMYPNSPQMWGEKK